VEEAPCVHYSFYPFPRSAVPPDYLRGGCFVLSKCLLLEEGIDHQRNGEHDVEILIYGLILFTLFHQSVVVALHYDSIMSYYSS
jgi:hypothetical protein